MSKILLPLLFHGLIFTFDDGPRVKTTTQILNTLKKYKIKAVFCVTASRLRSPKRVAVARRAVREGHIICNHSVSHPNFSKLTKSQQAWQIRKAQDIIKRKLGIVPLFFRPPHGIVTRNMWYAVSYYKLKMLMWNIDSKDWWPWTTSSRIYNRVIYQWKRRWKRGKKSIVLFHDVNTRTTKTLENIILRVKQGI